MLKVHVSSPVGFSERRFDPSISYSELRFRLEVITGIPADAQKITVFAADGDNMGELPTVERPLLTLEPGTKLDVQDKTGRSGLMDDIDAVPKYEMAQEEYAKRQDSLLAFKQRHKLGRFSEEAHQQAHQQHQQALDHEEQQAAAAKEITIASRCQVVSDGLQKRGVVRFVGDVHFKPGVWVGVEYDEPVGKNDGTVQGKRYFSSRAGHGAFVRPLKVQVGDFPEETLVSEDEL